MKPVAIYMAGEIVDASKINNRKQLAEKVDWVLGELAEPFSEHLLAPPVMALGAASFTAALSSLMPVFDFQVALNEALWPHRFRLGIGAGWDSEVVHHPDGPARAALETARRRRRPLAVEFPAGDLVHVHALEALAAAHGALVESWTPAAARHVPLMRAFGHQAPVAQALGVTQQVVSRTLRRARYRTLLEIERVANEIIADRLVGDV